MFKIVVLCILPLTTFELDYSDSVETEMRRYRRQTRPAGSDGAKPSSTSSIAGTVSPTTKLQPQPQVRWGEGANFSLSMSSYELIFRLKML